MRASVDAIVGCSIEASRASSFWVSALPPASAKNTGKCPDETPIAFRRWSMARANSRAAQLVM